MKKEEQDQLLRAIQRATTPSLQLSEQISLTPQLPTTVEGWSDPLTQVGKKLKLTAKLGKNTSLSVDTQDDGASVTLRKKF